MKESLDAKNLNIWGIEPQIFRQTKPPILDVLSAILQRKRG
jgi:hypothetical protein